jgi:hypothetical protein
LVINGAERFQWWALLLLAFTQHAKRSYAGRRSDVIGEAYNKEILPSKFPSSCLYEKSAKYRRHETCFYYTFTGRVKSRGRGSMELPSPWAPQLAIYE